MIINKIIIAFFLLWSVREVYDVITYAPQLYIIFIQQNFAMKSVWGGQTILCFPHIQMCVNCPPGPIPSIDIPVHGKDITHHLVDVFLP